LNFAQLLQYREDMLISGKMMLISMKKLPFYKPILEQKPPTEARLEKQAIYYI
jgi:hypothetical protein